MRTTVSGRHVARLLGHWSAGSSPLYAQLSNGLRELIQLGELPTGAFLPSERLLAAALKVSRTTVLKSYEMLRQEELLESRQGSGTWICDANPGAPARGDGERAVGLESYVDTPARTVDFSNGALAGLPMVAEAISSISTDECLSLVSGHGYTPRGMPELRRIIAAHLSSLGVPTTEEKILITNGSQQALHLLSECYLESGDNVLVEDATYRGALDCFRSAGARLHPLTCDEDGFSPDTLNESVSLIKPRLVYLLPAVNNPTGRTTSDDRCEHAAKLARDAGFILVDDQSTADTILSPDRPAPLSKYADSDHIVTIGSLSKDFWGGLRVGWIRASDRDIDKLARIKARLDFGTSPICQTIAARLFPRLDEARKERRAQLTRRLEDMTSLLNSALPEWTWQQPMGGTSLWVRLPRGSGNDFARIAFRYGVTIVPGSVFSPHGRFDDHIRITINYDASGLYVGVSRLATAWQEYERIRASGGLDVGFA